MRSPIAQCLFAAWICCALPLAAHAAGRLEPAGTENPAPTTAAGDLPGELGKPAPIDGPAGMVIVTDASLVSPFRRLADAHGRNGLVTRVRTLQSIRDAYPVARDDAERIRLFLKDARANWGIEFALMGGDEPLIPMRRAYIDQLGIIFADTAISLPTDQYYACLDGDWNADGDDRWGEIANPVTGDPGDAPDAIPELCVGRAPVTGRQQAQSFVDKTIHALDGTAAPGSLDVLLVSGNLPLLPPSPVSLFSPIAESFLAVIDTATAGRATFTRLYGDASEWPGALPLATTSLLPALEAGHDLELLLGLGGHGSFEIDHSFPPLVVTADELSALRDDPGADTPPHVAALSAYTTEPGTRSVGAALVLARGGGAVSVLGPSNIEFVSLSQGYLAGYLDVASRTRDIRVGEAMRANLRTTTLPTQANIARLTTLGNTLLGDPALPFPAGTAPPAPGPASASPAAAATGTGLVRTRVTITPNPSRVQARIALEVPAAEAGTVLDVAVIDVGGRLVRTLEHRPAVAGERTVDWDLRDGHGARVASGLYFARIRIGPASHVSRIVVW